MCRFAIIASQHSSHPKPLLEAFATMAEQSRTFDNDRQGDGWGVAWLDINEKWQRYRSLKPVWEDAENFSQVPETTHLAIHARSASFAEHKDVLDYNQPYISSGMCYVFNGLIRGATLPHGLAGTIGAEKIWSLLQKFLVKFPPQEALQKTALVLKNTSKNIQAANIGLIVNKQLFALNLFSKNSEYYTLRKYVTPEIKIIASEPFGNYQFLPPQQEEVVVL